MTVRIRAHHLLCMLTYVGKGYSSAFTANYDAVIGRLEAGEGIVIVSGPDDICAPMLGAAGCHCFGREIESRDVQAALAIETMTGCRAVVGERFAIDAILLERLRSAFAAGSIRGACAGCDWFDLCTEVAGRGYKAVRLGCAAKTSQSGVEA